MCVCVCECVCVTTPNPVTKSVKNLRFSQYSEVPHRWLQLGAHVERRNLLYIKFNNIRKNSICSIPTVLFFIVT